MTAGPTCRCLLCRIETQLLREIALSSTEYEALIGASANGLRSFPSPIRLLSHLKETHADSSADDLYRDLLAARSFNSQFVEALMILAFVPVLHGTVRRIAKQQTHLARADITQQALSVFLQVLRSEPLQERRSHLVFAISRSVKRQLFEWAGKEGLVHPPAKREELQAATQLFDEELMERHTLLRHFLHRCVGTGLLSPDELDLLIQIKLDGNTGDEVAESNSTTSNAVRQRMKRLLAKLRRVAGTS
jgi:DNA-directed RNA polymerase specialized sigma24 family protein